MFVGRTGADCKGPLLNSKIALTENTASVLLGAGVSLTLSNPMILTLYVHRPVDSEELSQMSMSTQQKLTNLLELDSEALELAPVGNPHVDR